MKTRDEFAEAANKAYDTYQKFMFKAAREFFGISDPTVEAVTEFELQNPIATTMTDSHLYFAGISTVEFLQTGWEIYREVGDGQDHLVHGVFAEDSRWIGWSDEPANLPTRLRLGDIVMDADWMVYRRYRGYDSDASTIAGVKMSIFESLNDRAMFDSLVQEIGKTLGTPIAPYQPDLPRSALPSGLLWNSFTVRALLTVTEYPGDEDEGIGSYRTYEIVVSRNEAHDGAFHFGCAAEQLLK
jgi:hypothetical protein